MHEVPLEEAFYLHLTKGTYMQTRHVKSRVFYNKFSVLSMLCITIYNKICGIELCPFFGIPSFTPYAFMVK